MVNNFLRSTGIALLSGSLIFLSFTGCNNSDEIGLNLTPPGDRFKYVVDSSTVLLATTLRQDSVTSEKRTTTMIGSMVDPVFGRSDASLMTQLRLSSNEVNFGVNPSIDSAIILLKYKGYYGDTTTLQSMRVYPLTQNLYYDSTYYSNQDLTGFFDQGNSVGEISYFPTPGADSVSIRLSDDFGNSILRADTLNLKDNNTWLAFLNGLYFQAQPVNQGGSIVYYDLSGGKSRMILYYHNDASDSLKYEVVINTNCAWVNLFDHSYTGTPIESNINDSINTHPEFYLQSMAGLRSRIKIELPDSLVSKAQDGVAINKAELIITLANDPTMSRFERPLSLRIFKAGANNKNEFIDDLLLGESYYGGTFSSNTSTYRFNVARHIQSLLHPVPDERIENTGFFLVITDERTSANRLVLNNGNTNNGMKLVITYTPLK
jgi:hypothetical protein